MRTIEIKLYKFEELSEEAQAKAIETECDANHKDPDLLHFFSEDCELQISEDGFEDPKVNYSLSCSQGDGFSFSAKDYTKVEELLLKVLGKGKEKTAKYLSENYYIQLKGNTGNYAYASKSDVDITLDHGRDTDRIDEVFTEVCAKLEDIYMELCAKLELQGYKEIEYRTGEEAAKENLIMNDYEFTSDGKIH